MSTAKLIPVKGGGFQRIASSVPAPASTRVKPRSTKRPVKIDTNISAIGRQKFDAIRAHFTQTARKVITGSETFERMCDIVCQQLGIDVQ